MKTVGNDINDVKKRRKERQRKIRRRRFFISFIVLTVLSAAVFAVLSFTVLFPIEHVTVYGSKVYSSDELLKAVNITENDKLLALTSDTVENRLRKKLPYVDSVTIKRAFPDTVHIKVNDAKEFACYYNEDKYYTVSEKNFVLSQSDERPQNLFEIITDAVQCEIGSKVIFEDNEKYELSNLLVKKLSEHEININIINVKDTYNISARVENRFDVLFGSEENLDKKIAHLKGMIEKIAENRTGKIDLSMWTSEKSQGTFKECALN